MSSSQLKPTVLNRLSAVCEQDNLRTLYKLRITKIKHNIWHDPTMLRVIASPSILHNVGLKLRKSPIRVLLPHFAGPKVHKQTNYIVLQI